MWPWEHAVIGYLTYSLAVHLFRRRSPTGPEAVTVVSASVAPDLIDKPLAWEFGVFPSGFGIAHSVFFAVPMAVAVFVLAAASGRRGVGAAFATGYLLHLPADVVPHYVLDGRLPVHRLLWPVATTEASYPDGFSGTFRTYLSDSIAELLSGPPSAYVFAVGGVMAFCALLWAYDGMPGVREPAIYLREHVRSRER
ncbi:metal-dependent hydrolase [Halorubrum sp. DTA98]|uniref:metal-dependent hydrolase n=1 Tax=Halorubrum sp. DTA98 TaxID=3402163 RepID=UPI003AAB5454